LADVQRARDGSTFKCINERKISMAHYIVVRHKVKNFEEWEKEYRAHLPKRIEAGLTEKHLLRGAKDPNEVIILFEAQDLNRAKTFSESADLREIMQRAGVVDKPDFYFLESADIKKSRLKEAA